MDDSNVSSAPVTTEATPAPESNSTESTATFQSAVNESTSDDCRGDATVSPSENSEVDTSPHTGERPEWLPEKFNDGESLAKSYGELEKQFGGFKGAPKDGYEYTPSDSLLENDFELNTDDPSYQAFADMAKEANMSNETFNGLINFFHENQVTQNEGKREAFDTAVTQYHEEQIANLGQPEVDLFKENIRILENKNGVNAEYMNSLLDDLSGGDSIRGFNEFCNIINSTSTVPNKPATYTETRQSLRDELARVTKMDRGPAYVIAKNALNNRYSDAEKYGIIG